MVQLSEQQSDLIWERLQQEGARSRKLEQDLFDHYCCYVEERMEQGAGFEAAWEEAAAAIAPNGVREIELELFFLMNFNKQMSMKRIIFLTGFIAAFLISTGTMFRTFQWPASKVILFLGFTTLLVTVLTTTLHLIRFLRGRTPSFWFRSVTGIAAAMLISVGFVFRILHFPGANIIYGLGTLILNFVFLPVLFFYIYKHGFVKAEPHEPV